MKKWQNVLWIIVIVLLTIGGLIYTALDIGMKIKFLEWLK